MADGSDLKVTEYDFPKPLLAKAKVQSLESADQPTYNDDLAKVVNQALNWEEGERKSADAAEAAARDAADKAEQKAREDADTALGERIDAETAARESADTQLGQDITAEKTARESADTQISDNVSAMQSDIEGRLENFVTAPTDGTPTQNMLDADLFETSEVNGDKGVTLKAKSITNEYLGDKSVSIYNFPKNSVMLSALLTENGVTFDNLYESNQDDRFMPIGLYGIAHAITTGGSSGEGVEQIKISGRTSIDDPDAAYVDTLAAMAVDTATGLNLSASRADLEDNGFVKMYNPIGIYDMPRTSLAPTVLPYTANGPTFSHTYTTVLESGTDTITENFNLVDFGCLQLITVLADLVITETPLSPATHVTKFITISPEKVFGISEDNEKKDGWHGVNGGTGKYFDNLTGPFFEPFLIAESPDNPTNVQSAIVRDSTNGTRIQVQIPAGVHEVAVLYLLGNMSLNVQPLHFN